MHPPCKAESHLTSQEAGYPVCHWAQSLPLKFLLLILKFRGAKGFEDTILPPVTQKPITAMCKHNAARAHIQMQALVGAEARNANLQVMLVLMEPTNAHLTPHYGNTCTWITGTWWHPRTKGHRRRLL